jgi:hypothetical protein
MAICIRGKQLISIRITQGGVGAATMSDTTRIQYRDSSLELTTRRLPAVKAGPVRFTRNQRLA